MFQTDLQGSDTLCFLCEVVNVFRFTKCTNIQLKNHSTTVGIDDDRYFMVDFVKKEDRFLFPGITP